MKYLCAVLLVLATFISCKKTHEEVHQKENNISIAKDWIKVDSAYAEFRSRNLETSHGVTRDIVPNEETAMKIAEVILFSIYGQKVYASRPYCIELRNGVWIIEGTLPKGCQGGVPYVEIQKKDGKVLKVIYGK
ncbi:YbbC/YhhH family protein [uncultured Bacteroides sp.]|uniref:YbbC/YhhH family protein n=1 Tax=uncultured Bacteroides sp. TaxID=162156 RepID=UPI002AAB2744|nr:YbbC/YhhH family protein [uncultured Bacteroides sp.]